MHTRTMHRLPRNRWTIALFTVLGGLINSASAQQTIDPRGDGVIRAGGCEAAPSCEYQAAPLLSDLVQNCHDGSWLGMAWPHTTSGVTIHSIQLTLSSGDNGGDLYLMGDGGGCPDVENILWQGCCAIGATGPQPESVAFCTGPISTPETTWVVLIPRSDPAVIATFDQFPQGTGHAAINLSGGSDCGDWVDLSNFKSPYGETYGGCYCVALGTEPCELQSFSCDGEEPPVCEPIPTCEADINRDGVVDPLDVGYVLARFGGDVCAAGNCNADANCDGAVDPLDAGYVLARLAQCNPPSTCPLDCR